MRIKIPLQIVELEPGNYHIIVTATFAGDEPGNWVVDTGASKTVFDKNWDKYYSVLEGETDEIHTIGASEQPGPILTARIESINFGKHTITNLKVALLDLGQINELYSNSTGIEICGLMGSDFLMKHKAVIDYKRALLILSVK